VGSAVPERLSVSVQAPCALATAEIAYVAELPYSTGFGVWAATVGVLTVTVEAVMSNAALVTVVSPELAAVSV
jgi:hypothetical protein